MHSPPVIALTPGEPAGIGPDLCVRLLREPIDYRLVVIADPGLLAARARDLGLTAALPSWAGQEQPGVYVLPVALARPARAGLLDPANAPYVLHTLERAIAGCLHGEFDALVTGPVQKSLINDAGIDFRGHTELLMARASAPGVVMLLACPGLRVALATTHVPLADVSRHITRAGLTRTLTILHRDLGARFGIADPAIVVCGLNPHAGESGHLGREEIETIAPVVHELAAGGMRVRGPASADTAFIPEKLDGVDAVLAMYHDQGLPVIKHRDFAHAVNVTLGLPFVRTSVDHGTALELAGTGRADDSSLRAALALARALAEPSKAP